MLATKPDTTLHRHVLQRAEFWTLTVSNWMHAVELGVEPYETCSFADDRPGGYRPTEFDFANPPSRADFAAVAKMLPWMHVWKETFLPIVAANDWPLIDDLHKASDVALVDDLGRKVGRLEVRRQERWENRGLRVQFIDNRIEASVVNRLPADQRSAAGMLLLHKQNWIREQFARLQYVTNEDQRYYIRLALHKAGFIKVRPKQPAIQS